jgi:pyruvate-ferredoxin/flavodoxin oxidoreductase
VSHLRFSPRPIKGSYLVSKANFVACHQSVFIEKLDMLATAVEGATFLLNSPYGPDEVWDTIPIETQKQILDKKIKLYVVDAYRVARDAEMGVRINTVMQTCFFKLANVLPEEEAIAQIKYTITKTYGKRGETVLKRNFAAVDGAISALHLVKVPGELTSKTKRLAGFQGEADDFIKGVLGEIMSGNGDDLPVSVMPVDGTFPTATTQYEKRSIALDIPIWDKEICIQCGLCSLGCPHAAIRMKAYAPAALANAPQGFESADWKGKEYEGWKMSIQVAPDDCTGCGLCIDVCPAKNREVAKRKAINMEPKLDHLEKERANYDFFLSIPDVDRTQVNAGSIKGSQLLLPLFEYSGACAGCGETPYVKLITQFFGDRMLISNATGCSSIYGGNLPSTPYAKNADGRGPSWSNSLFEDNAEFGFGFRLAIDQQIEYAGTLLKKLSGQLGDNLVNALLSNKQETEEEIAAQRKAVAELKTKLAGMDSRDAKDLLASSDYLARRSVWILGGDGWAYDIGYGGLDHVFASGRDVNILVMDTEVYSNTGGQASKATPRGAVAKFAAGGKPAGKKDLGMMAMSYGNVYVGQISLGANPNQAIKAIRAAEAYRGTSLIIAYAHCIAHGINMTTGMTLQKEAVACGYWPLYRFDPTEASKPFSLDSKAPKGAYKDFAMQQARYAMLARAKPEDSERLLKLGQEDINSRWNFYEQLAATTRDGGEKEVQA